MAEYTFYKPEDGSITVNLNCPPEELKINLRSGESYVEGFYSPTIYQIKGGKPVERINPRPFGFNPRGE